MKLRIGLLFAALACTALPAQAARWPHGAKAAVVLTYDDSLDSQLDHAVPVLDRARLKGTFFLSNVRRAQVPRWRAAAREGHELANHSLFHPCLAATYPADPRYTLEAYTPADAVKEIAEQEALLTAIDGRDRHGFGTPCGNTQAGGKDYLGPLFASGLVSYIRTGDATPADLRADPATLDPLRVPSRAFPEGVTGEELIGWAKQAEAGGGLAVYVFHGVGGDYLQTSDAAHRELVAWLAAHRREVWVTTLRDALDWVRRGRGR